MEINIKTVIWWIVYPILGFDGFRIGNVVSNRHLESVINRLQLDKMHLPKLNKASQVQTGSANNRLKRFFEFNPVAFSPESIDFPDEPLKTMFHFSPFITSLENFRKHSAQREKPFSKFKSIYIKNGEKPKTVRPYVDHFSGVKSIALHFQNPIKENRKDTNYYSEKQNVSEQPIGDISMRAFLRTNTEKMLGAITRENKTYNIENNKNDLNIRHNEVYKPERTNFLYEDDFINPDYNVLADRITKDREQVNPVEPVNNRHLNAIFWSEGDNKLSKLLKDENSFGSLPEQKTIQDFAHSVQGNISPKELGIFKLENLRNDQWSDIPHLDSSQSHNSNVDTKNSISDELGLGEDIASVHYPTADFYESGHFEDITIPHVSAIEHAKDGFEYFIKDEKTEPYPLVPSESQSYDQNIESFYPEDNELGFQGRSDKMMDNHFSTDPYYGEFENIIEPNENIFDQAMGDFGDFKMEDSKPYFGIDAQIEDGLQTFEQNFGAFSSDYADCDTIDTKFCATNSECSCYGFYQCHENKCVTISSLTPDDDSQQTPISQWHEEPVDLDSWGN